MMCRWNRIKEFQKQLDGVPDRTQAGTAPKIAREKTISDALAGELKVAADEFKQTWK